jgi:hypothetical protein
MRYAYEVPTGTVIRSISVGPLGGMDNALAALDWNMTKDFAKVLGRSWSLDADVLWSANSFSWQGPWFQLRRERPMSQDVN